MSKLCKTCDNDKFEYIDGFYYCTVCGAKTHDVQDLQLSDDELFGTGGKRIQTIKPLNKVTKKEKKDLNENEIDLKFSTYEVINYVLRQQVKDLIQLGCNKSIKKYVLEIWMRYLNRLGVAFHTQEENEAQVNESNIKWPRDKEYFEAHNLKQEYAAKVKVEDSDDIKQEHEEISMEHGEQANEDDSDDEEEEKEDEAEMRHRKMDEIYNQNLELADDDLDDSQLKKKKGHRRIVLTSFEYVRLPYTVIILNLALLTMKSSILITDIIRFIRTGLISYFNIDEILPKSMKFKYHEDTIMFNAKSLPKTDLLRYLTKKFAIFLDINIVRSIDLRKISSRFLHDLNLPREMNYLVNCLMIKLEEPLTHDFNLLAAQTINLEAKALAYITCVIIIVCQFEPYDYWQNVTSAHQKKFFYKEWFNSMQNVFANMGTQLFGRNLSDIHTIEDIRTLNYHLFKHRFIGNAKAYISNYHKKDIIEILGLPLGNSNRLYQEASQKNSSLFYISNECSIDFRQDTIQHLLNESKMELCITKSYRCSKFKEYIRETCMNKKLRGAYELGLRTNSFNFLIDSFTHISQSADHYSMYSHVDKLLFKIAKYS